MGVGQSFSRRVSKICKRKKWINYTSPKLKTSTHHKASKNQVSHRRKSSIYKTRIWQRTGLCKEFVQLQNKGNNSVSKWAKDLDTYFTKEAVRTASVPMSVFNVTNQERHAPQHCKALTRTDPPAGLAGTGRNWLASFSVAVLPGTSAFGKVWQSLRKLRDHLLYDPASQEKWKHTSTKKACTWMFIAAESWTIVH